MLGLRGVQHSLLWIIAMFFPLFDKDNNCSQTKISLQKYKNPNCFTNKQLGLIIYLMTVPIFSIEN